MWHLNDTSSFFDKFIDTRKLRFLLSVMQSSVNTCFATYSLSLSPVCNLHIRPRRQKTSFVEFMGFWCVWSRYTMKQFFFLMLQSRCAVKSHIYIHLFPYDNESRACEIYFFRVLHNFEKSKSEIVKTRKLITFSLLRVIIYIFSQTLIECLLTFLLFCFQFLWILKTAWRVHWQKKKRNLNFFRYQSRHWALFWRKLETTLTRADERMLQKCSF